jgi:hypothetical protein
MNTPKVPMQLAELRKTVVRHSALQWSELQGLEITPLPGDENPTSKSLTLERDAGGL